MLILNVDDDIDDREIFCDALNTIDSQISCIHVDSGKKALEFLRTTETLPDFIFIDINMPKMNGYECVHEIRSHNNLKNIQIVMFSTTFNPNELIDFTQPGIKFLTKPSKFSSLVQSIKTLII